MNYIEMKIEKIEKKLKELEQEIKKPKENTDIDIELAYLNDNVGYGTEYGWDKSFGNYNSIDGQNNDYNYKIEMDNKDKWIFKIQNKFGETIVKMSADKKELTFEQFADFVVKPIISNIELGNKGEE